MYKPTRHSYEKRMKNQRRKAKAGLLLATTLTAGMAVNPCPAVAGLASYLTGTGNVSVVQAAETLSISKENVTKINISEQTPEEVWGDMQINIVLDTPGTYLLEGSNYINESYIDTQITVPEGVEVNIILADGFSINNDGANYVWGCGYARSTLGVNPFVINGTANLYIDGNVAISGQSTQTNYSDKQYVRGLFAVSGKLHIKEVKEGAVVTLENDVFDRTKWESQLSLTPGMFDGSGTVIIEEGTFDSKEISHGVNLNTTNISLSTMGDDESEEKFTTSVQNFIINGGNYGVVEIYEAKQHSDDYLYQTNLLINNASLTRAVCDSDRNASIEYGSCTDVKENETGTGYIITNTNHDYGAADYSWSADKSTCTASRVCQNDKTHVETEKATVTSAVTTQPTYEKTGVRTYTAAFKNAAFSTQTQTETIAKRVKPQENTPIQTKKTSIKKTFQITVAKGKTYTAGNFKYKLTNASTNGKGTVTLAATKKSKSDSKFTSCKITDTVKIGGKTFKVTAIGDNAFKGYKKLKTITIESKNIKSVGKDAVKNIHKKATIKVPKDKVKAYKKLFDKKTGFTSKMKIKKA